MNRLQAAEQLRRALQMFAQTLTDEEAMEISTVYPAYEVGKAYAINEMLTYGVNEVGDPQLYRVVQAHTSQADWTPDITPALWTLIDVTHAGTIDDPIPIPSEVSSFEYEWGKYYSEDGILYLCNRQGGKEGDTYVLDFKPSALVGHYFKVVE